MGEAGRGPEAARAQVRAGARRSAEEAAVERQEKDTGEKEASAIYELEERCAAAIQSLSCVLYAALSTSCFVYDHGPWGHLVSGFVLSPCYHCAMHTTHNAAAE